MHKYGQSRKLANLCQIGFYYEWLHKFLPSYQYSTLVSSEYVNAQPYGIININHSNQLSLNMKTIMFLTVILITGCGSITPSLESGQGFYSDLPKQEVEVKINSRLVTKSKMEFLTSGCFAPSQEAVMNKIINPEIRKFMAKNNAFAATNVMATRIMPYTIFDAITGAFIWGCSYWNITGELIMNKTTSI